MSDDFQRRAHRARLSKRELLGFMAAAPVGAIMTGRSAPARAATAAPAMRSMVGDLDLHTIPVIDAHMHPYRRTLISAQYDGQRDDFTNAVLPRGDFPGKEAVRARLMRDNAELVMGVSRRTGYFNYVARVHGVEPTIAGFDSVLARHIGSDAAFMDYVRTILDRENIATLVMQSPDTSPGAPKLPVPAGRSVWTYAISAMTGPEWARSRGLATVADALAAIDRDLETAAANGCRGFKSLSAYNRSFAFARISPAQAEEALRAMKAVEPSGRDSVGLLYYDDPAAREHVRTYEDFIFRHIFGKAGALGVPIVLHTAAILHPQLRAEFNDPRPLYDLFMDPEIIRADTRFLLIHGGYPTQGHIASFISQFTNVYVDVSHVSKYPAVLEEVYRALLAPGPSYKVLHGSDSGGVPEETAYCAWNSRMVLARVLNEYRTYYGWSQSDVAEIAENVLHRNARRLFRVPG